METNMNHKRWGKSADAENKAIVLSKLMPHRRVAFLAANKKIKIYQNGKLVEEPEVS